MAITLSNLAPAKGSKTKRFRVGRGNASGNGTTAGRGTKGQKARTGGRGGLKLMGLKRTIMKLPKFKGQKPVEAPAVILSIETINKLAETNKIINRSVLLKAGIVAKHEKLVKVLGNGSFKTAITLKGIEVSSKVKSALEQAGGKLL